MPNPVVAIAGSSLLGVGASVAGARSQSKAAAASTSTQLQMSREAREYDEDVRNQNRRDAKPWTDAGKKALRELVAELGRGDYSLDDWEFEADPGYDFRKAEGQKAIENSAAARGMQLSGRTLKSLDAWTQDYASGEYDRAYRREASNRQNKFNMKANIAGAGQIAQSRVAADASSGAANVTGIMRGTAVNVGNNMLRAGEAKAGMYGDIAAGANRGISNYLLYNQLGAG